MLNLANRHIEVRRLVAHRYGRLIAKNNWDLNDVLQAVHVKLWVAESGPHPYSPSKGSWSHWVLMVASSVVRNIHRQEARRAACIPIVAESEDSEEPDLLRVTSPADSAESMDTVTSDFASVLTDDQRAILAVGLRHGFRRSDLVAKLGVDPGLVVPHLMAIRKAARAYFDLPNDYGHQGKAA